MSKKPYLLWAIFDHEGKPVGLAKAKTSSGAKKKYEEDTGGHRDEIYVDTITLNKKGYFSFPSLK